MPRSWKSPTPAARKLRYISQLVARRQEPAADAIDLKRGAQLRRGAGLGARGEHVLCVLLAGADRRAARARDQAPETSPDRAGALIERRRLEIAPAVRGMIWIVVEDVAAGRTNITGLVAGGR